MTLAELGIVPEPILAKLGDEPRRPPSPGGGSMRGRDEDGPCRNDT